MASKPYIESVGLVAGLAVALQKLRQNSKEGVRHNLRLIAQDKVFLVFLAASVAGFARLASSEAGELSKDRRAAAKAAKTRSASTLALDAAAPAAVAKAPVKAAKRQRGIVREPGAPGFWRELGFLLRLGLASRKGKQLLGTQFGLLVLRTLLTVRATKLSTFYLTRAISDASWVYWARWCTHFGLWMSSAVVVNSGLRYTEQLIALELRNSLTRAAHARYMANNAFYRTAVLHAGSLDNVDQRICSDVEAFSREAAFLYGHSFKPILEFILTLQESAHQLGLKRPLALFASQVLVTTALRSVTPSLGRMVAKEAELEGSFRAAHSRLIAHAEEVAFLKGADTERGILNSRLSALVGAQRWHALQRIRKSVAENIGKFQGLLVGGIFVHVPFLLRDTVGEGQRISTFRATEELMLKAGQSFVEILMLSRSLDELAGHTHRIGTLFRALEPAKGKDSQQWAAHHVAGDSIAFQGVTVSAPEPNGEARVLVKALDLTIPLGRSLIITGPNGSGKSSLLRVLAGLWAPAEGTVVCPQTGVFWLPQRPFLVSGTLRDQVTYPALAGFQRRFDDRVMECLRFAGVDKLADTPAGLDREHTEWDDILSGGERQRIGFARMFYHKPKYAVLDEATSAVNAAGETELYSQLQGSGITVVSVAHRLELRKFHASELKLVGDGTGKWEANTL